MLSGIITGLLLALFIGGCIWAWSPKHKRAFEQAALIPLLDEDADDSSDSDIDAGARRSDAETPR